MKISDKREFEAYLARCSDAQVLGVYAKERDAKRWDYAHLAKAEMLTRNISVPHKNLSKPVRVARSSLPTAAAVRAAAMAASRHTGVHPQRWDCTHACLHSTSDMPWCEHCQCYHMPTARHISKKVRDENRQIVAAMKASWSEASDTPKQVLTKLGERVKRTVDDLQRVIDKSEAQPQGMKVMVGDGMKVLAQPMHMPLPHVILVGDIVSGFEVYGPFDSGHDAVTWKQQTGNRERTQGQWFLMPLKTP